MKAWLTRWTAGTGWASRPSEQREIYTREGEKITRGDGSTPELDILLAADHDGYRWADRRGSGVRECSPGRQMCPDQ